MNWEWVILLALVILGAGLIAGGVVAFRGSQRTGVRAFGASAVAMGVVMWVVIGMTIPASSSGSAPEPTVQATNSQ